MFLFCSVQYTKFGYSIPEIRWKSAKWETNKLIRSFICFCSSVEPLLSALEGKDADVKKLILLLWSVFKIHFLPIYHFLLWEELFWFSTSFITNKFIKPQTVNEYCKRSKIRETVCKAKNGKGKYNTIGDVPMKVVGFAKHDRMRSG